MEGNCWSIKVYARIKPFDNSKGSELTEYDIYDRVSVDNSTDCLKSKIVFNHKPSGETVNNKAEQQTFRFCKVFDQDTQQEEIYEVVAKPVVDSVLEGYNGTVFAYGQTGSGKTYSITGGPDKYEDRGIIPRSIQQIFNSIRLMPDDIKSSVFISYCEIYNETGYDLLDAAPKARKRLEDLPRVSISEDLHGNFHFRNLSLKKVETEEEALNLLFLGDSNRVTAETPMNKTSSRSHCVFTIVLATRSDTSGMSRRSKLNLVDLAGSERVSKTGINGKILEEAKNINLSLHFLEQVIVALNTPDCKHIPYRNSMMTIILKDSLGGNCLTTMLATLSAEVENVWETISTCRFAQRVALIKNEVFVNEELDPQMEVKILKEDIKALKRQLALVGAESVDVELTPDEIGECHTLVQEILSKENIEHLPQIPPDLRKINQCTWLLKCAVTDAGKTKNPEVQELVGLLRERDEEIASLRGGPGMSTEGDIAPFVQTTARPSSQSSSSKYFRPRGESTYSTSVSSRIRARDSQQLDDDRDIASRVENSMRRLASLRSLLDHTRTANNSTDEGMNEFIASAIHQIHDDERDYRMLMAIQYDMPAAEDLLMEQIEISKLKMLFDFRNLYQEHAISVDSKSGNTYYDQRSVGPRDGNSNQLDRCLATLDEVSSNLTNDTVEGSVNTTIKSARSKESTVSTSTRRSVANKTDISLDSASFVPDAVPWARNVSAVSAVSGKSVISPRGASQLSTVSSGNHTPFENLGNSTDEVSSARRGSNASATSRRTLRVSINGSQPSEPVTDDVGFRINGSSISTATRTRVEAPSDNLDEFSSSRSDGRSLQIGYTSSSGRRKSVASQDLPISTAQDISSTRAEAGSFRDASAASVARRVYPIHHKSSFSNVSVTSIDPSEAPLDNVYSVYPNETCSDSTRRSFLPQLGKSSFAAKPNSLSYALAIDNALALRPTTAGSAQIGSASRRTVDPQTASRKVSAASNLLPTDTPEGEHSDDACSLHNASAVSTVSRRSAGPHAGTSNISTISKAPPNSIAADIANSYAGAAPLSNTSVVSTATGRSIAQQAGTSTVSTKSKSPQSNFSVHTANAEADEGPLANTSAISTATGRSISQQAGTSTVSTKSRSPQSNFSVHTANAEAGAGPLANTSAVSTATRRSVAPPSEMTSRKSSAVSTGTTRSLSPAKIGASYVSVANVENEDNGVVADVSPTNSLILDFRAPHDEPSSLPNSSFNLASITQTGSFVSMAHEQHAADSPVLSYQKMPSQSSRVSTNDPNLNVDSRDATGERVNVGPTNATSGLSDGTGPVDQDDTFFVSDLIPLESLHFPAGAVSSVQSTATSTSRRQVKTPSSKSTCPRETSMSTGQSAARSNNSNTPSKGSAVSTVSGRQTETKRVSPKSTSVNADGRVCSDENASRNPSGVSPRQLSTTRNSGPQEVSFDDGKERPPVAVLHSAMKSSTSSAAAPKSVSHQLPSTIPSAGNEIKDTSLCTLYKGGVKEIPESQNDFQPREDMHQCDEETKCLALTATQAEFDSFYGVDRSESYTCTITIPSTTPGTRETMACCDVIPCSSEEFGPSTKSDVGNTSSILSEESPIQMSQQNYVSAPAPRANPTDCPKSEPLFTIEDLCLTGDPEIDEEIIAFYKARNCMG